MKDRISLKWGTLKSWNIVTPKVLELLREYSEIGASFSAMMQKDTPKQKELICKMIDESNADTIYLEWDDVDVSKEEAKKYVMEYRKDEIR